MPDALMVSFAITSIYSMNSTDFKCLCCGAGKAEPFLLQCEDYYMRKSGRFDYYLCDICGLVQLHPIPLDMSGAGFGHRFARRCRRGHRH